MARQSEVLIAFNMEQTYSTNAVASEYIKRHKILELFENTTAQLIYHRPSKALFISTVMEVMMLSYTPE